MKVCNEETIETTHDELSLANLDAVVGSVRGKFHYVEMGGDTWAIGYNSAGEKLVVKVT